MNTNCDTRAAKARILDAALPLVAFNGWGHATWEGAVKESGLDIREARRVFPRASLDLALEYEATLDREMVRRLEESASELESLRFRDRVVYAVRTRFELADREVLRKSTASFALPHHAAPGAHALWKTADTIWNALNDKSRDVNWYTKRMLLSGILASTNLFWIGDDSQGQSETWEFLDRRIEDVMRIERGKARLRDLPGYQAFMAGPGRILKSISAPPGVSLPNLPGFMPVDSSKS